MKVDPQGLLYGDLVLHGHEADVGPVHAWVPRYVDIGHPPKLEEVGLNIRRPELTRYPLQKKARLLHPLVLWWSPRARPFDLRDWLARLATRCSSALARSWVCPALPLVVHLGHLPRAAT